MRVTKKRAWIAAGYCLSVGGGIAAVAINELIVPDYIQQSAGGMIAFGDLIVFMLVAGLLSLAPTWFLLKPCVEKNPRNLVAAEFLFAALGPASWLAVRWMLAGGLFSGVLGLLVAFGAIVRVVFGPILLIIEGATIFLVNGLLLRTILALAMLMDLIPLSMFALHMAAATHR